MLLECLHNLRKFNLSTDNIISIISVVVTTIVGVYIARSLTKAQNNKRTLKDNFIAELKECREDYRYFLKQIYNGNMPAKELLVWFKMYNIRLTSIIEQIEIHCDTDGRDLQKSIFELRSYLTELPSYEKSFNRNDKFVLEDREKLHLVNLQQNFYPRFYGLLIDLNNK